MKIFIFFFFFLKFLFFYVKFQIMFVFFHWKVKGIWKKSFFVKLRKLPFFRTFSKKLEKKTEFGQLQTKNFCGKYLWVVSISCKKSFFVGVLKDIKKFIWNNKKQHQKVLFFKKSFYPLLVCLFCFFNFLTM